MLGLCGAIPDGNSSMSLLNDMLRDLNHHSREQDTIVEQDVPLLNAGRKANYRPGVSAIVIFLLIFFNVLALRYAWHKWFGQDQNTASVESSAQASSQASVMVQNSQPVNIQEASSTHSKTAQLKAEQAARVEELFRQAERALSMDRLTSPVEDNAYSYYQKILELSPGNDAAQSGLVNIAARYLAKGQEQLSLGNRAQADALINRARFVAPDYVGAQPNGGYGRANGNSSSLPNSRHCGRNRENFAGYRSTVTGGKAKRWMAG
jgi:hypothetical protein